LRLKLIYIRKNKVYTIMFPSNFIRETKKRYSVVLSWYLWYIHLGPVVQKPISLILG
jgi:hypothetical protein